jgi:hypothetical protein
VGRTSGLDPMPSTLQTWSYTVEKRTVQQVRVEPQCVEDVWWNTLVDECIDEDEVCADDDGGGVDQEDGGDPIFLMHPAQRRVAGRSVHRPCIPGSAAAAAESWRSAVCPVMKRAIKFGDEGGTTVAEDPPQEDECRTSAVVNLTPPCRRGIVEVTSL